MNWRKLADAFNPRRHWYETLTPPGRIFVCAMIFCFSAVIVDTPVLQLLLVFASVFIISFIAGVIMRPRLTLSIRPPAFAECDRRIDVPIWVRNDSNHSAFDIGLEILKFPNGWVSKPQRYAIRNLRNAESTIGRITLQPTKRGLVRWPQIEVVTNFPFNLFRFWRAQTVDGGLVVLPRFHRLNNFQVPKSAQRYGGTHVQQSITSGEMREYAGSREYQPGVAVRRFDYASWARLGHPVVREFTDQNKPAAAVVVDMCATMAHPAEDVREACLSLAAAIVDGLSNSNHPLSWYAVGSNLQTVREQPIFRQRSSLMESLALAEECKEDGLAQLSDAISSRTWQADIIYFITPTWDTHREQFLHVLGRTGTTVNPIFVTDQDTLPKLPGVQIIGVRAIETGTVELNS